MKETALSRSRAAAAKPSAGVAAASLNVLDTMFLDEPAYSAAARTASRDTSSFDLFADEDAETTRARVAACAPDLSVLGLSMPVADPSGEHAASRILAARPSLLAACSLLAALAAFLTVRACQVRGVTPVAIWNLFGF
jgi:hypothetical protein